jgi:hypothetical protein
MWMMCIGSAFFILTGALCFYTKDIMWDVLAMVMEKLGFEPERTRVWNILITLYGIIALVIGVYALIQVFKGL